MNDLYQVIIIDNYYNMYHLGFFKSLEDQQLINSINGYITDPRYHLLPGDIQTYPGTFGSVFDTTVAEAIGNRIELSDDDYYDQSDDLNLSIRGFIFDKQELQNELKED